MAKESGMPEVGPVANEFLLNLLTLQQDGKYAISAPSNWTTQTPLLEVTTEVDGIIDDLYGSILSHKGENTTARWHFFIGSPGNGKSAAIGKLCRKLNDSCQICDEEGVPIGKLPPSAVPYAINVFEGGNKFASVQIIQDASVVPRPFSREVDAAKELLRTVKEAWDKGISLVVCTNRGVLEKAHGDNHANHDINSQPWFKVISHIVAADTPVSDTPRSFESKKAIFKSVRITSMHLDKCSLLLGRDTFDRLLQEAIKSSHWSTCESCPSRQLCPFKANRDWLASSEQRDKVLCLLRRAEVFSGQVIVFREALALVSLFLAGCSRDYNNAQHPCKWVQGKHSMGDIFSLAARRIYMCLFASHGPYGLESHVSLRDEQGQALKGLLAIEGIDREAKVAIQHLSESPSPSTDVGVTRLLGPRGAFVDLDPCSEGLPVKFYESWDSDYETILKKNAGSMGVIEQACIAIWKKLEQGLEKTLGHEVLGAHWALRRWSSNYLLHFGALIEGRSAWSDDLDHYAELLELVSRPLAERTSEEKRKTRALDALIGEAISHEAAGTITLSDNVTLEGAWAREYLKPKIVKSDSQSISLEIEFGSDNHPERTVLSARMYLWLNRLTKRKLDRRCVPMDLLGGSKDARVRAAARSKYAFLDKDIQLAIRTDGREKFKLIRTDGEVEVEVEGGRGT